jgi:SAM-dependent methyltransferase
MSSIESIINEIFDEGIQSASLSSKKHKDFPVTKINVRKIELKKEVFFQASSYFDKKVIHKNYNIQEIKSFLIENITGQFKQAIIYSEKNYYHLLVNKRNEVSKVVKPTKKNLNVLPHDRKKNYFFNEFSPNLLLNKLGIMSKEGLIIASMQHKFKQINHFINLIEDTVDSFREKKTIKIVDFGCGSAYLTFTLYYFLKVHLGINVEMYGIDLKEDVIENCKRLASEMNYDDLYFLKMDINDVSFGFDIDLVVTLHACDTATDAALEKALLWNAKVILSVPCCQHELFSQVQNNELIPLLEHGILKEKFTALITDASRGKLLEIFGYKVEIVEFIDMEHTPKNILIKAIKVNQKYSLSQKSFKEYQIFNKMLNINPNLQHRLKEQLKLLSFDIIKD